MEIKELWEKVCTKLMSQVNDVFYNVWIIPLEPYDLINGNEMIIIAPSQFHRTVLKDQHINDKIEMALYNTIGFEVKLTILVDFQMGGGSLLEAVQKLWYFMFYTFQ